MSLSGQGLSPGTAFGQARVIDTRALLAAAVAVEPTGPAEVEIERLRAAVARAELPVVYVANLMTEPGESIGMVGPGFLAGAMITVGIVSDKLRFDLAVAATEAAGLQVSADVVELSLSQGKRKGPTP